MTASDALRKCMKSSKITQTELADAIGSKQTNISMYLRSNMAMQVSNLLRMANACGFDLVLVDRENVGNAYVIGERDELSETLPEQPKQDDLDERIRRIVREELAARQ